MVKDINAPTGWSDNGINKPVDDNQELLATLQQDKEEDTNWGTAIQEDVKDYNGKEKLIWNTDAILEDLRKNHVIIEEDVLMMWYRWKKVHIDLPAVWSFEWYKFDCFVSYGYEKIEMQYFNREYDLKHKSFSMKEISELLQAINKYMAELQGEHDEYMDYENINVVKFWNDESRKLNCKAWDCLRAITWLNWYYWTSDWEEDYKRDWWGWFLLKDKYGACCYFTTGIFDDSLGNLFLRLSD